MADAKPEEEKEEESYEMEYRMLGNTGLKVSTLSFGFWATFGVKEGVEKCKKILKICRDHGVNFFDNAEAYGANRGDAETIMGEAMAALKAEDPSKWRRSDIVVSTKIFWGGEGENEKGLSRKHVVEGVAAATQRLQLDYVDLVFCHRPDPLTPTEEIVRTFTQLIRDGKCFYWGTSEWTVQQITEAYWIAKIERLIPPCFEQPQYNMFKRDNLESNYLRLFQNPYKIGTTVWSPLASGILTGKYNKEIPDDSRMAHKDYSWLKKRWDAEKAVKLPIVEELMNYAAENFNTTVTCLALAWVIKNKNVSTCILGATKEHQILENLKAIPVAMQMTAQHMKKIDDILKNKPAAVNAWGRELKLITNPK